MKKSISDVVETLKQLKGNPVKYNLNTVDINKIDEAISELNKESHSSDLSKAADILLKFAKFFEILCDLLLGGDSLDPP